jgi:hypothetical protein
MGVPPDDPSVDLRFLNDPTETEEQRRAFGAGAIHYARRACALADELLEQREGQAWSKSPEGRRAAPLAAAAAASACADVAQTLELRVFHLNNAAPRQA